MDPTRGPIVVLLASPPQSGAAERAVELVREPRRRGGRATLALIEEGAFLIADLPELHGADVLVLAEHAAMRGVEVDTKGGRVRTGDYGALAALMLCNEGRVIGAL